MIGLVVLEWILAFMRRVTNMAKMLNFIKNGEPYQVIKDPAAIKAAIAAGGVPSNTIEWDEANKTIMNPKLNRAKGTIETSGDSLTNYITKEGAVAQSAKTPMELAKEQAQGIMSEYTPFDQGNYYGALMDQSKTMKQTALDESQQGMGRDVAAGQANLAMSGGLNSGAREGMMNAANRANIYARQKTYGDFATKDLGIQAEQAKAKSQYDTDKNKFYLSTIGNIYAKEGTK